MGALQGVSRLSKLANAALSSDLARGIGYGVFWAGVGAAGTRILALVTSICVSRLLSVDGFGQYGMIQTTLGSLGVVAGLALGLTVTKSVAEASITGSVRESSEKQLRRNSEILSLLYLISGLSGAAIGIMTYLLAPWLSIYVLKSPDLEYPLRISTVPIFFNALNGIQLGALAGIQAFHLMARLGIASGAISLVCTVTGAHIGGLVGACAGLSISSAINFIVVQATLTAQLQRRGIMLVRSGVWQHRHILTSFSLPAFLAALLVDPVNWLCAAMLVNQPGGYQQIGSYYISNQWMGVIAFVPNIVGQVIFPRLSAAFGHGRQRHVAKITMMSMALNAAVTIPLVLILSFWSGKIMGLYNPTLASQGIILNITLLTGALISIVAPVGGAIAAASRMWVGMGFNLAWAASYVLLSALLVPYGALGLVSARAVAYGLHAIWVGAYAAKLIRLK